MAIIETLPKPRREKLLRASADVLVALCKASAGEPRYSRVVAHALPDDAEVARVGLDPYTGEIAIAVRSATFDAVQAGCLLPVLDPPQAQVVYALDERASSILKRLVIAIDAEQDEEAVDVLREARALLGFVLADDEGEEENGDAGR